MEGSSEGPCVAATKLVEKDGCLDIVPEEEDEEKRVGGGGGE